METPESYEKEEAYITTRNLIQSKYLNFRTSTADEVQQLKKLSAYPRSLVAHEIEKCVNDRIPIANLLDTLLTKMKLLQSPPTPKEVDEFYEQYQSNSSKRCLKLLDSGLTYAEMVPVIYSVLETMRDDEVLRTDRPLPTAHDTEWQVKYIKGMNESDAYYSTLIDLYKNDNGIVLTDHISLSTIQQEWLNYINCESDTCPKKVLRDKPQGVTSIVTDESVLNALVEDDIPEF